MSLDAKDIVRLKAAFQKTCLAPIEFELNYDRLWKAFFQNGMGDLFLDLLIENRRQVFSRLRIIAKIFETAIALGREAAVSDVVSSIRRDPHWPVIRWGHADYMRRLNRLGKRTRSRPLERNFFGQLQALKYRGVPRLRDDFFNSAAALSERVDLPKDLLDHLYRNSRYKPMRRGIWERHVRTAFCSEHIANDLMRGMDERVGQFIGGTCKDPLLTLRAQVDDALRLVDRSKGLLVVGFHGGFYRIGLAICREFFPDSMTMRKKAGDTDGGRTDESHIGVEGEEWAALFKAVRSLEDGKTLFMAPDGMIGRSVSKISVLGMEIELPSGAAYSAYVSKCNTAWMTLVRDGASVVPNILIGPTREKGEGYLDFSRRWFKFYGERLEETLTGDPRNISLSPLWVGILTERAGRGAARHSQLFDL